MISRYSRPEMVRIWSTENKFQKMLEVEIAVARVQAKNKIIPEKAARDIAKNAKFKVSRIEEIEQTTKHDVIAFVSNLSENVGENGRYIHYGLTSSDVLDTALALLIKDASELVMQDINQLEAVLIRQVKRHQMTICAGRTHGMHAEITTFGVKLAGFLAELRRHRVRVRRAFEQCFVGELSGAVGTYSSQSPKIEREVCDKLGLQPETVATQVVPRDRHAEVFVAFGLLAGFFERLAVELRHLQRTELGEVVESFSKGQKGSSAMPHKKNPISAENITGLSRLLRSYVTPALENMALWHERDISHSSVERVLLPDAFLVCDYALVRLKQLLDQLHVDKERMRHNVEMSQGQLFASQVLLLLIKKGLSREDAYQIVQFESHNLKTGEKLSQKLKDNAEVKKLVKKSELEAVFLESTHKDRMAMVIDRALKTK
jgi:adenylosuccinate lyase